jgi:hypothetical protein
VTPYIVIFLFLALLALSDAFEIRRSQRLVLLLAAGVVLALFAGLRPPTFRDYSPYKLYFEGLRHGIVDGGVNHEPGFWLLNRVAGLFMGNYLVWFVALAALSVGIMLKSYKDYTPWFLLPVIVYFSHAYIGREMTQVRAGLAAAICLYSMRHVIAGRFWRFALWAAIAASIHLAAVVFFVVYPLAHSRMGRRTMVVLLGVSLAVGLAYPLGALFRQIPVVDLLSRAQSYADSGHDESLGVFTNPTVMKQLLICTTGLLFYNRLNDKVWGFRAFLMSYLISTCWLIVWNDFAIMAGRLATFLSVTEGILLASYICLFERRSRPIYVVLVIIFAWTMLATHLPDLPIYKLTL